MAEKRLVRSVDDRMIAGVAAGVAEYFGLDASLVRVAWVVAVVFAGFGLLAYIILWIVLPESDEVGTTRKSSAIRIAEERYARGEITPAELAEIRANLNG